MALILTLAGSPSPSSRTERLLREVGTRLGREGGHEIRHLAVRDLPAAPLLAADHTHPALREALAAVAAADAVVIGTPVYKAAYSGLLKTFLDVLTRTALHGKELLPLLTGGSRAHVLALDYALCPVLAALGGHAQLRGRFVLDEHLVTEPGDAADGGAGGLGGVGGVRLSGEAEAGVAAAVAEALAARERHSARAVPAVA
ncbi:NADPH-dependent FMN reductase [Streptomyces reniochalinae]|uniref:FMN reductase (NADPH) n=1 Tax=Streptomyces reniochalinae TaxID=2250578 RepID=A0A367EE08_9ACTN|nr:NADPH-dependent FMN reductase [Streptomyces reniochalinae]RCG15875.1 FMN reductase (NADPH) [Streptomyces reniochalinae]